VNSLKPLLTVAVLAGIGYGVYVRINSGTDAPPPAGVAAGWDATPKVQLPDSTAPGTSAPWGGSGSSAAPPFGSPLGGTAAPPAPRGGEAPPFSSPPAAGSSAPSYAPPGSAPPVDATAGGPVSNDPMPPLPGGNNPYTYLPPHDAGPPQPPGGGLGGAPAGAPPGAAVGVQQGSADSFSNPPAGAPPAADGGPQSGFAGTMANVKRELEAGQLAAALQHLSTCHGDPRLAPAEHQELCQLLDQVAGTVVYSTQHLLEPPYEVQPGERLEDIGQRYNVPWQLLAKINGIDDPQSLRPGERLKVVRGPFYAVVNLDRRELTLMLADGLYAGRFGIGVGREHPPVEGVYSVSDKVVNPVYRGRDRAISADDPSNPLGERWIGLGSEMAIHGTDRPENVGRTDLPGSISLSPRDAEDVFDILSVGSKVTIRR
jgi:LysM repeat protein